MNIKRSEQTYEVMENEKKWRVSSGTGKAQVVYEVTKINCPTKGGLEHFMVKTF